MKKNCLLLAILSAFLFLNACAIGGAVYTNAMETPQGYRKETGFSFFPNQETSIQLARADLIGSQAEINRAFAERLRKKSPEGESDENIYSGLIVNDDLRRILIVRHPNSDQILEIPPGGSKPILTDTVPAYVMAAFENQNALSKYRIHDNRFVYNGQKFDYGARLPKQ